MSPDALVRETLTAREVSMLAGISEATLSRLRKTGAGPRFVRLSPRRVTYVKSEVMAWLEGRLPGASETHG